MEDQICLALKLCLSLIDDDKILPVVHVRELGRRAHFQRCSPYNEQIRVSYERDRFLVVPLRQKFPV